MAQLAELLKKLTLDGDQTAVLETLKKSSQLDPQGAQLLAEELKGKNKQSALKALSVMNFHESLAIDTILPVVLVACADKIAPVRAEAEKVAALIISRISAASVRHVLYVLFDGLDDDHKVSLISVFCR
jgi:hypothetical protein